MINFTEEQVELIYEAVSRLQTEYGSVHPMYFRCEEVLNQAHSTVVARRKRLNAICDS
jgi:hypothetical protein